MPPGLRPLARSASACPTRRRRHGRLYGRRRQRQMASTGMRQRGSTAHGFKKKAEGVPAQHTHSLSIARACLHCTWHATTHAACDTPAPPAPTQTGFAYNPRLPSTRTNRALCASLSPHTMLCSLLERTECAASMLDCGPERSYHRCHYCHAMRYADITIRGTASAQHGMGMYYSTLGSCLWSIWWPMP